MLGSQLLHFHQGVPDLALIGKGGLEPLKLFGAQSDGDGFGSDSSGPLVARPSLARLAALQETAQGNPPGCR